MEAKKTLAKTEVLKPSERVVMRSFMRMDFPIIRKGIVAFALSLSFGIAIVNASSALRARWGAMELSRNEERAALESRLRAAQVERQGILEFQSEFEAMRGNGLIGDEKRLDLIELLEQIRNARKLLPLTYTVAPQSSLGIEPTVPAGSMDLRGSRLILSMPLLHEWDLLNLLDDLREHGVYAPSECNIKRLPLVESDPLSPRLQADCTVYWITIGKRSDATPLPPRTGS
jgi:hypothetical protein